MQICLYTSTALPTIGGQELVVDALARQYLALGHGVIVLAPRPSRRWRLEDQSLPYPVVRHPRFYSMRRWVEWYRWWLLRLNRLHRFDVIHCHGLYPTGYLASLYRGLLQTPVVITSHGEDVYEGFPRLADPLLRGRHLQAVAGADALIAISRFTRDGFGRLGAQSRRIIDIPNGVDFEACAAPASRPADLPAALGTGNYALFLGRLERRKGVDLLLEAVAALAPVRKVQLIVAGDGRQRAALQSMAGDLGLADRVHFIGWASGQKKAWLLQHARCAVVPSRQWEAFGLVVLESYAAGCPVIATQLPGLADLVQPGRTGWVVPPESPGALAESLEEAFDPQRAISHAREDATLVAQQYAWREIALRHLDLYAALAPAGRRRAA